MASGKITRCGHELVANAYVVGEARRNLMIKYPASLESLARILKHIDAENLLSSFHFSEQLLMLPEKDRPVMAATIHHRCQVLLTGEKCISAHFTEKSLWVL